MQVNPALIEKFEEKGMKFVGRSEDGERMEIMELKGLYQSFFISLMHLEDI